MGTVADLLALVILVGVATMIVESADTSAEITNVGNAFAAVIRNATEPERNQRKVSVHPAPGSPLIGE